MFWEDILSNSNKNYKNQSLIKSTINFQELALAGSIDTTSSICRPR